MIINSSRVGGIVFLVLSCLYGYFANDIPLDFFSEQEPFNARSMPRFIAACGILVSVLLIVTPSSVTDWRAIRALNWRPALLLLAMMSAYGFMMEPLGFGIATVAFLSAAFVVLGERKPRRILLVTVPLVLGFWLLMDQLGIYLGPGTLVESIADTLGVGDT